MTQVFATSVSSIDRHGVFAIEKTPPAVIQPIGTGVALLVGQFPWGPDSTTILEPSSPRDRELTLAPNGMNRTGSGYLSTIRRAFPTLKTIRVLGTAAAAATGTLTAAGPTNIAAVVAKYLGVAGNSIVLTVSDATDLDANHFNLTATVSGLSGTTVDSFVNVNFSGVGADSVIDYTQARLIGSITKSNPGRPANGTYAMSTGAEGTINSARYIGTAGSSDFGIAKSEGDDEIRHIFVDDPGNTDRAAVNAALSANATLCTRTAYINGNSGLDVAGTKTAVALNRSDRLIFVDPWAKIVDDTDGTVRLVPPAGFAASVKCQLPASTSLAWKNAEVQAMLQGITALEADRGGATGSLTSAGVCVLQREAQGGYTFESDNTTITPSDPSRRRHTTRAMKDFIAISFTRSVRGSVDAPNLEANQDDLVHALNGFMENLLQNSKKERDPNHNEHVKAYKIDALNTVNDDTSIANGQFFLPLTAKFSTGMEKIILSLQGSEFVAL